MTSITFFAFTPLHSHFSRIAKEMSAAAVSVQQGPDRNTAADTWRRIEQNAFGPETLIRNSPSHPQPDFIPIASTDQELSSSKRKRYITGKNTKKCTPWVQKEYTNDIIGLHEEILDFHSYIQPRRCERYMRLQVFDKVKRIILGQWPHAQVCLFGSFCTCLYLPTSDIDVCVMGEWIKFPLFSLEEALLKADIAIEDSILVLDKTTVPIIKFIDKATEVKVDISFNQHTSIHSFQFICHCLQQFPLISPLAMVIKQFLNQRQLNEVYYGGINSYSLILMLVSFFQLHPRNQSSEPTANLGVLLTEFFELYGRQFNYTKVGISVLNGGYYFPKEALENGMEDGLLYIQDPLSLSENSSRGCYGIMQVKQSFEHAFNELHMAILTREDPRPSNPSLLSKLVQVSEEVHEYRQWVETEWPPTVTSPTVYTPGLFSPVHVPYFSLLPNMYIEQPPAATEDPPPPEANSSIES